MMNDFNTTFYVIDYDANRIYLLDENYEFISEKTFPVPNYMVTVNLSLYITGDNNIWKTDKYLNVLITYSESAYYNGIYFNSTEYSIYVAPFANAYFKVFDLDLNPQYTVSLSPYTPFSLAEYNNELFVGTVQGSVLVIVNKAIIRIFMVCSSNYITSIVFDNCGFMAISCYSNSFVNLYYYNGTFTDKTISTAPIPMYLGFDSNGYFVILSKYQTSIYN